jgi:hypothetical protein
MQLPPHQFGLFLHHNEHRDAYQSAEAWLAEHREDGEDLYAFADAAAKHRAMATDEIWTLFWYPDTPVGFYAIAAPTLEELLTLAQQVATEKPSPSPLHAPPT